MNDIFDVTNIILLGLAIFIFFKLRSVLGRRTGNERPPFDPYSKPAPDKNGQARAESPRDNVVPLPGSQQQRQELEDQANPDQLADKVAPAGSALNEALRQVLSADRSFEPEQFLQGAKAAYEMIVTAFAEGDRKTLKPLLSREVFDGFNSAISDREGRGKRSNPPLSASTRPRLWKPA